MTSPTTLDIDEWKIVTPTKMLICGMSGSGKSDWCIKALKNSEYIFLNPPDRIIYCYGAMQPKLAQLANENPKVELHEGFQSSLYENHSPDSHLMLCIDDCMSDDLYKELSDLFTKG